MKKFASLIIGLCGLTFGFGNLTNAFGAGGAGTFSVTFPNTNISFTSGNQMGITWNVAGTNQSPLNVQNVQISLSLDGGATFPHVLAQNTPNDGNELFIIPNLPTLQGRIRVTSSDGSQSAVSPANFTIITASGIVATPTFSHGSGSFSGPFNCIISCATPNAKIYFTTNGNNPIPGSTFTRVYGGPFLVNQNTTIRAIAMRQNFTTSFIGVANYTFPNASQTAAAPSISHATGSYTGTQTISLSTSTPSSAIFYSTTGNVPVVGTTFTKLYTGPFAVSSSTTIRAMSVSSGMNNSPVTAAFITIINPIHLARPIISPGTGSFTNPTQVSISCATPNVVIYYSITGNEPIPGAPHTQIYTQPFMITSSTTVRAIATRQGIPNSPVATSFLTYQMPIAATPSINLPTGTYSGVHTLSISSSTPGAQIYFTTSGNVPVVGTTFTRLYTGPLTLFNSTTIRAISVKEGMQNSPVAVSFISFVGGRKNVDEVLDESPEMEFTVFPNPGTGPVTLKGFNPEKEGNKIQIFNALGSLISSHSLDNQKDNLQLDLSDLKPGIYFIKETSSQSMKRWIKK